MKLTKVLLFWFGIMLTIAGVIFFGIYADAWYVMNHPTWNNYPYAFTPRELAIAGTVLLTTGFTMVMGGIGIVLYENYQISIEHEAEEH